MSRGALSGLGSPASDATLAATWSLLSRLPQTEDGRALAFLLVNDTHALAPYRQAALWLAHEGVYSLSGVVQVEANAPYVQWLEQVVEYLHAAQAGPGVFTSADLPQALSAEWAQWWPAQGLWLPGAGGGVVFLREPEWTGPELEALSAWMAAWSQAFLARQGGDLSRARSWRARIKALSSSDPDKAWWRQGRWLLLLVLAVVLAAPVRLSVLAPAELVPSRPAVVRAPLDGVIEQFQVVPNQPVRKGAPLFGFDEAVMRTRLEVAQQALAAAEVDYRQTLQLALSDARAKSQLALLTGKIEERRAEVALAADQMKRSRVLAPEDGVVLMDDPSEWIGKPVTVGERILRIAAPDDREVEAWLPLADAISLAPGATVTLYLQANPLAPVSARLRYVAHDAQARPDGQYAYRVRATLEGETAHRVGLKGTAKLQGDWVPLAYWILRRPWAALRGLVGL